ncbi:8075_t:CDS:1, partial [Acaulospora morrowiae]
FPPSRPITPQPTGSSLFDELRQATSQLYPQTSSTQTFLEEVKNHDSSSSQTFQLTPSEPQSVNPSTPQSSPISPSSLPPLPPSTPSTPIFSSTPMTHLSSQHTNSVENASSPVPTEGTLKIPPISPSITPTSTIPKSPILRSQVKRKTPPPLPLSSTVGRPPPLPLPPTWPTLKKINKYEPKKDELSDISLHHRQSKPRSISEGNDDGIVINKEKNQQTFRSKSTSEDDGLSKIKFDIPLNKDYEKEKSRADQDEDLSVLNSETSIALVRGHDASLVVPSNIKIENKHGVADHTKTMKNNDLQETILEKDKYNRVNSSDDEVNGFGVDFQNQIRITNKIENREIISN